MQQPFTPSTLAFFLELDECSKGKSETMAFPVSYDLVSPKKVTFSI
jgi:hypothetical protein